MLNSGIEQKAILFPFGDIEMGKHLKQCTVVSSSVKKDWAAEWMSFLNRGLLTQSTLYLKTKKTFSGEDARTHIP